MKALQINQFVLIWTDMLLCYSTSNAGAAAVKSI